jgi:hypothetical protein
MQHDGHWEINIPSMPNTAPLTMHAYVQACLYLNACFRERFPGDVWEHPLFEHFLEIFELAHVFLLACKLVLHRKGVLLVTVPMQGFSQPKHCTCNVQISPSDNDKSLLPLANLSAHCTEAKCQIPFGDNDKSLLPRAVLSNRASRALLKQYFRFVETLPASSS